MATALDIKAPTSWGELTLKQLRTVAELMALEGLDKTEMQFALFSTLADVKLKRRNGETMFTKDGLTFRIEPWQLMEFCKNFDFIFDAKPVDIANPTNINPHIIGVKFRSYYNADAMMLRYHQTGRKSFIVKALRELGQRKKLMSATTARMIWLWWAGVQGYLQELYPKVFPSDGGECTKTPYQMLQDIMLMLNDNRPQDNRLILDADAHDVLAALNTKIEQNEAIKEAMKK